MPRRLELGVWLAASSFVILIAAVIVVWSGSSAPRVQATHATLVGDDDTALAAALRERDNELAELRAEVSRLQALLEDRRQSIETTANPARETPTAVASSTTTANSIGRDGLAGAVDLLRALRPDQFAGLTAEQAAALTELDLRDTKVTDADLASLAAALPALQTLRLSGTAVTDEGLAYLRALPNLTAIDLRATKVTAAGIAQLPCFGLTTLHLTDSRVNGADIRWFPAMPNLRTLKLNRLAFNDDAIDDLSRFSSIQHLELDGTAITDVGLRRLLAQNVSLQRVELRSTAVTTQTIGELRALYPNVELVFDQPLVQVVR